MGAASPTVFLDRDGTINVDTGYPCDPQALELISGAADAIALLKRAGFRVLIVTNQAAVGRGYATEEQVQATNAALIRKLEQFNREARVDQVLYCPHHPDDGCDCRKPQVGMIADMLRGGLIDPGTAWVVGDKLADLRFGANAGIPSRQQLLVLTGNGLDEFNNAKELPEFSELLHFPTINEAAAWIAARTAEEK